MMWYPLRRAKACVSGVRRAASRRGDARRGALAQDNPAPCRGQRSRAGRPLHTDSPRQTTRPPTPTDVGRQLTQKPAEVRRALLQRKAASLLKLGVVTEPIAPDVVPLRSTSLESADIERGWAAPGASPVQLSHETRVRSGRSPITTNLTLATNNPEATPAIMSASLDAARAVSSDYPTTTH